MTIPNQIKNARRVSVPIVAVTTPDPAATMAGILAAYQTPPPAIAWDCLRGLTPLNKAGGLALAEAGGGDGAGTHYGEALSIAEKLPGMEEGKPSGSMLFLLNPHNFFTPESPQFAQGIWNLRDQYKANRRTVILIGPSVKLPAELANDVLVLDEPLPGEDEIREAIEETARENGLEKIKEGEATQAVSALAGLSSFMVEQVAALCLTSAGYDVPALWQRKCIAIEQTPGLKVWRGANRFSTIGGLAQAKAFLGKYLGGKTAPRVIVFIDEIEKALAGAGGDTSGTTQDQLGALLSYMQDEQASGMLLYGPAGTGKSNLAKASGAEAAIPVVSMDLGAMKDSLVGSSEARMRAALKAVTAMGQGKVFFIATCNSMAILPPELRRRFKAGTFFMDLPTKEERETIWAIYAAKHSIGKTRKPALAPDNLPNDEGWTGAEIETCCEYAANFGCTLKEAAAFIVPVSKSAADVVEALRRNASGKFLSASAPGLYKYEPETKPALSGRAMAGEEN